MSGYKGGSDEGLVPHNGIADVSDGPASNEVEARTDRGRLIQEMQAENERRSNLRIGSANRMAKYDMGASAKVYGLRALATVVEIMENVKEPSAVRLAAAREVLDRGFGRPKQVTEVSGIEGDEIRNRLIIEFVGVPAKPQAPSFEKREGYGAEREPLGPQPLGNASPRAPENVTPSDHRFNSGVSGGWQAAVKKEVVKTAAQVNASWVQKVALDQVVDDVEPNDP